jgi:transcriptional regulator with XRE-family HTH domain
MTRPDDDNEPSLADQIRRAAAESGLSVNRIAKESGVDQSLLNKFLTGTRPNLRLDMADRLFRFLGLRVVRNRTRKPNPPAEGR